MTYKFYSSPNTPLTHAIPLGYPVGGYTLSIEFSKNAGMNPDILTKPLTGSGTSGTVTLTAAEVEQLQNAYFVVRGKIGKLGKVFQTGTINYTVANSESALLSILDTEGRLKEEYIPTRLSDATLRAITGSYNVKH